MWHTNIRHIPLWLYSAFLLLILAACGPAATPDPCASPAVDQALTKLLNADREFSDTVTTASSTARIGLAPVLLSLQKTLRETENLDTAACLGPAKTQLVLYMTNAIEGFSKFARQANDYEFYMKEAGSARAEFVKEIEKLAPKPTP